MLGCTKKRLASDFEEVGNMVIFTFLNQNTVPLVSIWFSNDFMYIFLVLVMSQKPFL